MDKISFIIELVACVTTSLLLLYLLNVKFEKKNSYHVAKTMIWEIAFISISFIQPINNLVSSLIWMILYIIFACLFYKGEWKDKLLFAVIINVIYIFISITCINAVSWLAGVDNISITHYGGTIRNIEVIIIQVICIGIAHIAGKMLSHNHKLKWMEELVIGIVFIMYLFLGIFFFMLILKEKMSSELQVYLLLIYWLTLVTFFVILWLMKRISKAHQSELENELLNQRVKCQEELIYRADASYQKMRTLRHDLIRYFNTYQLLLKEKQYERLELEMNQLIEKNVSVEQLIYTDNPMVNTLIYEKDSICKDNNIPTKIMIQIPKVEFPVEIVVLLSNLIDNAIEAEALIPEAERNISIELKMKRSTLSIWVSNYIEESVLESNSKLRTSKKDKEQHGFGMHSIREIVQKYDGKLEIYEENNQFCVHAALALNERI